MPGPSTDRLRLPEWAFSFPFECGDGSGSVSDLLAAPCCSNGVLLTGLAESGVLSQENGINFDYNLGRQLSTVSVLGKSLAHPLYKSVGSCNATSSTSSPHLNALRSGTRIVHASSFERLEERSQNSAVGIGAPCEILHYSISFTLRWPSPSCC